MNRLLAAVLLACLPPRLKPPLLNLMGHKVHRSARIGLSIVRGRLYMGPNTRIGHLNWIACRRIAMRPGAYVGSMNVVKGPISVQLGTDAAIGNRNLVTRIHHPVSVGPALLRLLEGSKITAAHSVDCTASVLFGNYAVLAGRGSQIWTHGYVHDLQGSGRSRIDGTVRLADNVYIGSMSCISAGVRIVSGVTVGAMSSVATDLTESGVYVSQPLRFVRSTPTQRLGRYPRIDRPDLVENVYWKGDDLHKHPSVRMPTTE